MTLKSCRRQLEEDLGLEKDALKEQKELIGQLIDQVRAPVALKTPWRG